MTQYIAPNMAMAMQYSNQQGMDPSNRYGSGILSLADGGFIGGGNIQGQAMPGGRTGFGFFSKAKKRLKKLIPKEAAGIMQVAAPFVAPHSLWGAAALSGLGQYKSKGKINPLQLALSMAPGVKGKHLPWETTIGPNESVIRNLMNRSALGSGIDKTLFGTPGSPGTAALEGWPGTGTEAVEGTRGWLGKIGSPGEYSFGDTLKSVGEGLLFKGKGANREIDKMALAALALGGMSYMEAKKQMALSGDNLEDYGIFSAEDYEATDWEGWAEGTHLEGAAKMAQGGRVNYGIGGWLKKKLGIGQAEGHAEASGDRVAQDPEIMRQKLLSYFRNKYSGNDWKQDFRDEWSSPFVQAAHGGRIGHANGGIHNARPGYLWGSDKGEGLGGEEVEADMRFTGGFMPYGEEPKADDVPARLSKDEFVFTDEAVAGMGGGDVNVGAERLYNMMKQLEQQGAPGQSGIGAIV